MKAESKDLGIDNFNPNIFKLWDKTWLVLTSGNYNEEEYNSMTVAWGSMGIMWKMPFVMIVVRPTRHTFGFINNYNNFSLCAFPEEFRSALNLIGTQSGRDMDKIKASGLTPIALEKITAPGFAEADLTIECRKIYWEDFDPAKFIDPEINMHYEKKDYHRMIFGEVLKISGDARKYSN